MIHNSRTEISQVKFWKVALLCIIASTLVMGAGWGIRGSFGHCRGAMMPGAMLGLVIAVCAGRPDWWGRSPIIGLLAGVGWAIGGSCSYGLLVGYTLNESFSTSTYGYFSLMIVGALYGSIGCGLLGLALTQSRSFLENALWPMLLTYLVWLILDWTGATEWSLDLVKKDPENPNETHWLFDTVWLYALVSLPVSGLMLLYPRWRGPASLIFLAAVGWWLVSFLLVGATGFRINPSRNDSWAGVLGVLLGLVFYLIRTKNRASFMLLVYGLIGGGIGFPVGQFFQALGRLKIGLMGTVPFLAELDHWTLMEQTFGYCMGLTAALGVLRLVKLRLTPADGDPPSGSMNWVSVWILLGLLWVLNAGTNYRRWQELELLKPTVMNVPTSSILFCIALLWLLLVGWTLVAQRYKFVDLLPSASQGKAQLLALLMMLSVMSLYVMLPSLRLPTSLMFLSALALTGLCVIHSKAFIPEYHAIDRQATTEQAGLPADAKEWRLGWTWIIALLSMLVLQVLLGFLTSQLPR